MGPEEMESCARFRPAMDMSEVAMKPEGVRFVVEDSFACSDAIERSRRALAFSLFPSWAVLDLRLDGGTEDSRFGGLLRALVERLE